MRGHHHFGRWRPLRWLTGCNVSRGRGGLHGDRRIRFLSGRNGGQADVRRGKKVRAWLANFACLQRLEVLAVSHHFGQDLGVRRAIDGNASQGHWVVGRQCIGRNRLRPIPTKTERSNSIITTMPLLLFCEYPIILALVQVGTNWTNEINWKDVTHQRNTFL